MKCCDVTAGMLREPVVFERRSRVPTGAGGFVETWAPHHSTRAHLKAASGFERLASDRVEARMTHKAVIRYTADLREDDRAVIRGRVYNIRAIDNVEFADRWLKIDLEGGAAT